MRPLEFQLEKQLSDTRAYSDIVERARHEVAIALETGNCDIAMVSRRCGIPPWTLKGRLKQRGLTFQDLLTSTRLDLAKQQLARGTPITNIAADPGYSQVSAFSRAFRQWTGVSRREYLHRECIDWPSE